MRVGQFWAVTGLVANLGLLGFFKYAGLLANSFGVSGDISDFLHKIPLPVGISFFTFQGISLVIDVWSEKTEVNSEQGKLENVVDQQAEPKHWMEHARNTVFYIAFFPQLVAGPIVKANEFFPQIKQKFFREIKWDVCFQSLVIGYFLKMFVADNLKDFTYWIQYPYFTSRSTINLLCMLFGYSMQIFADFAGYSLIAIGVAGLFGYQLPQNFNFPYISASFSEFWRRWHISLSSWLRDYLYFPLGGNRKGNVRTYFNLFVVMFLGGLWHGAAWSYAIWGTAHGVALAVERLLKRRIKLPETTVVLWLQRLGVFAFVTLTWLLFKLPEFSHVVAFLQAMGKNVFVRPNPGNVFYVCFFSAPVILYHGYYLWNSEKTKNSLKPFLLGTMLFLLLLNSGTSGDFIYFQF